MSRRWFYVLVVAAAVGLAAPARGGEALPQASERRVLIVSIDGLRPDVLLRAKAPNIRRLMASGSFTFYANTTAMAITIPSHVSMVTGVPPTKHGLTWNGQTPLLAPIYPAVPTLFGLAKKAGYTTALAAGKGKFYVLTEPNTLDWTYLPKEDVVADARVADHAIDIILNHQPRVMLVHFPTVDTVGHHSGWGGPEQLQAVENADHEFGRVMEAIERQGMRASMLIILTADHGGAGKTHGANDGASRHIPWIISAPGVRADHDLTLDVGAAVRIEDTFATACWWMGIPLPEGTEGKAVTQAFKP